MKRMLYAVCMTSIFAIGAGVSARAGSMATDQMDKKDMMKDGQVTVSGCVAAGMEAGQYKLTNAMMMSHSMMDKDKMPKDQMAKDTMTKPAMADHGMTFDLIGGNDLKAHMGHKVEVTGSLSKSDMEHMAKMDKMDKDKMMADKDMKAMKLNVKSVKMVSANCS